MTEFILIALGIICVFLGVLGCMLPIIPGIPLSYAALLLLQYARETPVFNKKFLIRFAIYSLLVILLEYILPLFGAKLYGTSKRGIWGAAIGMLFGLFIIPPVGMICGLFLGAVLGELSAGKESSMALKAGMVTFVGSMFALLIKISLSLLMAFHFFIAVFRF